jgi:thiol-disulfide isomerase/thioredoxin
MFRPPITRIVLIIALICGLAGCNSNDPPPKVVVPGPPLSGSLNTLGWTDDSGNRSVFSEFRGKVLVLDFYATWCVPCRDSIPHLVGLQKKHEAQGLQVIGLNVGGPDDPAEVPAFAKEFGIQYPLAIPDDDLVMFLMGDNNGIPQTFVFDRQGQLVERLTGFGPGSGEVIDRAVEAALQAPAQ